jgi:hypothetical protein
MSAILVAGFLLGRGDDHHPVRLHLVLGLARIHHHDAHPPRRPPRLVLGVLCLHPIAVLLISLSRDTYSNWFEVPHRDFYGLYSIVIPVYGLLFIPMRIALSDDPKRFLERSAKIQVGLFICVYCLSYAPALLNLPLRTTGGILGANRIRTCRMPGCCSTSS